MKPSILEAKIKDRTAHLAVIGLGYVGLPVAALFADAGFDVLGVDIQEERIAAITAGVLPIPGDEPGLAEMLAKLVKSGKLKATNRYENIKDCDVVLIAVETPVDEEHIPQYDALRSVLRGLGPVLKKGALVVVESTLAPGTMKSLVAPELEANSGGLLNEDFYLGHCPERVMPGKLLENLRTLSRVIGGATVETTFLMDCLYRCIVQADLDPADWITAELVKTVENAYRDVQIAFANEVALICESAGGDAWKVRQLVNKSPFRQMHLPGAGVGGHCIPKDPWLLAYAARGQDSLPRVIPAARQVNDGMPTHMARLAETCLKKVNVSLPGSRILILGYAYLEDSGDDRNSPSEKLAKILEDAGAEVVIHDPYIPEYQGDLLDKAQGCDAVVVMVGHRLYRQINLPALKASLNFPVLVDGRHIFDGHAFSKSGWIYACVGIGF
jgi:UDP-N-acetyl-D-mannosaminuronic acid dehydrogenase